MPDYSDVELKVCPIIREKDGLAMSSRNVYLNEKERKEATTLRKSLVQAKEAFQNGETDSKALKNLIISNIKNTSGAVDYVEIIDFKTLQEVEKIQGKTLIALAVKFTNARLIDNIILE